MPLVLVISRGSDFSELAGVHKNDPQGFSVVLSPILNIVLVGLGEHVCYSHSSSPQQFFCNLRTKTFARAPVVLLLSCSNPNTTSQFLKACPVTMPPSFLLFMLDADHHRLHDDCEP